MTIALLLFLFPLAYSPGPGNMIFAANGARFGVAATLRAMLGYHLATWGVTFAIGLGLGGIVAAAPGLGRAMQIAGAVYVLWLALRMAGAGAAVAGAQARVLGARGGALLLLLNPKAHVIIALMFSQFLVLPDPVVVAWISTVFTLNNLVAFTLWTLAGDMLARQFRDEAAARRLNRLFAALLAGVALWMLVA